MEKSKKITAAHRNGNLHIKLNGDFDQPTAVHLEKTIRHNYRGSGNVFINTTSMGNIHQAGRHYLMHQTDRCGLPKQTLYFIGKKDLDIVPDGCRLLVPPAKKKGGCKGCGKCNCGKKSKCS